MRLSDSTVTDVETDRPPVLEARPALGLPDEEEEEARAVSLSLSFSSPLSLSLASLSPLLRPFVPRSLVMVLPFSPPSDEPFAEPRSLSLSLPEPLAEFRRAERGASSSLVTPRPPPLLLELSLSCFRMLLGGAVRG